MMYAKCWNCSNDVDISNQIKDALRRGHETGYDVGYSAGIRDAITGKEVNETD